MGNLMRRWAAAVGAQPRRATQTNPGTILIAEPKINALKVTFAPVQSGSGTPSPSNVRPISGYDSIAVSIGADTVSASLGGTYFGGTVDLVSGVFTVTMASDVIRWGYGYVAETKMSNYTVRAFPMTYKPLNTATPGNSLCDRAIWTSNVWARDELHYYFSASGNLALALPNGTSDDTYVRAAYDLETPQTVQLTPQSIAALRGMQTVTSDAGSVEITYYTV